MKSATIQDVARRAGVSTATVSRALARPEKVSEATRTLVAEAVNATGYRVNRLARSLRTQRADAVLVLLPDLGNPFFSTILEGMSKRLSERGISMLVASTTQMEDSSADLIDYFESGRADGLIILDGGFPEETLAKLAAIPACKRIVFTCEWNDQEHWLSVRSENAAGAEMAIQHLHELGHKKIGHVRGPEGNVLTHSRADAAIAQMRRLGHEPHPDWIMAGDFSLEAGVKAARHWMGLEDRPTAVFCAADLIAFGFISELTKNGLQVPRDVSVVGFDDIELAKNYVPPLTTIRQDRFGLGTTAAELLTGPLNDQPVLLKIPVELVPRQSSGPAPI